MFVENYKWQAETYKEGNGGNTDQKRGPMNIGLSGQ